MADILPDIYGKIFLLLPVKSLIRLRAVCKSWRAVIDDRSFVKAYTNKHLLSNTILVHNSTRPPGYPFYSFDLETLNFTSALQTIGKTPHNLTLSGFSRFFPEASCDGLILIAPENHEHHWEIWNPITHERLELPKPNFSEYIYVEKTRELIERPNINYKSKIQTRGLGYDQATDDYKVVVIDFLNPPYGTDKKCVYETHIYSLKFDSWRKIENWPCEEDWYIRSSSPGVFLNGALHWILRDMIFVFDLGTEKYSQIKLPALQDRKGIGRVNKIDVLGGCLFLSDYGFRQFDVWVMKDYGVHDSWMKLFSLVDTYFFDIKVSLRLVACTNNKLQYFLQDDSRFYLFDIESNSIKLVSIHGLYASLSAQIFHGSIFLLHDNCGVNGSVTTERRMRERKDRKRKIADTKLTV